jgi:hypothetical protein
MAEEISFDLVRILGELGISGKGWKREVGIVSWNGRKPKLDIRDWDPAHERMGKGITMTKAEAKALKALLDSVDIETLGIE